MTIARYSLSCLAIAILLVFGAAVVINARPLHVRYHNWQMQHAWHQMYSNPLPSTGDGLVAFAPGGAFHRYEYHRQKLVALGDIVELHYTFEHLKGSTAESEHFNGLLLRGLCPRLIDFESPYPRTPQPMRLTVWCRPGDVTDWDAFVAKHDVITYRGSYMTEGRKEEPVSKTD